MKPRLYLAAAVLTAVGLAAVYQLGLGRTPPAPMSDVPQEEQEYFAEYDGECGVRLLKLARSESGPFELVFPAGLHRPDERLRRHAWEDGRFLLQGRLTGKQRESSGCGIWPEFEVLGFRPWGRVRRCASPGAADVSMLLYTENLPEDRYAPEDFIDGPWPPLLEDESCRHTETCAEGERRIQDCAKKVWCCRLMPEDESAQ
jgi:hypothetical protein